MKIIETTFERLPRERLVIGFEGENLRATVRIDCASVFAEYPNATPALIVKPLFADAYPVVVDRNGTDVDWLITSEILSFTGDGEIQLVFYKDQVICKSAVSKIRVSRSLTVTGDMPDPVVQWIEDANRKLAEVDAQIVELEGMVDTATDAATRAEQSASTASTKAEQAAGSAATATEKATEANNAAGTATAKAAEAALSATQASNSAMSAANSESGATAKAVEATTAANTATAKAEQATEAAQTATEKARDASASATAAHASATDAASSATAASASETAAKASETAASTSASQAAQSAQGASADAQTATQKAAEATQSATDAETFAGTATTKAEEAAASAQSASDAKTAVEQTAEQLADSLEQIDQNTQDIAELDERKANIDGYYPDMTVGNAEQLNSSKFVENSEPYTLRTSGGTSDIGNREYLDAVVGGTLAWNQIIKNGNFADDNGWNSFNARSKTVADGVLTITPNGNYSSTLHYGIGKTTGDMTELIDGHKCFYAIYAKSTKQDRFRLRISNSTVFSAVANPNTWVYMASIVMVNGFNSLFTLYAYDDTLYTDADTISCKNAVCFDLTQMFGTAVADYLYNLETATAGAGVAVFRSWFPNDYYEYNPGELLSVEGLQSHDMVGFNQWDEEWEVGRIAANGRPVDDVTNAIRSKNFIKILPNTAYYYSAVGRTDAFRVYYYDSEYNFISANLSSAITNASAVSVDGAHYIKFYLGGYGSTYKHDICINLAHNGSRNGEYEPYEKHSYPLDSTVVLRGIPKVGANGVYWDGDRYLPDGTVERRYGVVDLGTLTWGDNGNKCWVTNTIPDIKPVTDSSYTNRQQGVICTKYSADTQFAISGTAMTDKTWLRTATVFAVKDTAYENAAAFKSAMSGVLLVYELATPTTETAQPYHSTQWVSDWGAEEFVSTGIVPVGHETRYPANLRDKLQHLPDAASGNGSYLITQTDGQMVLTPFPAPPSTAGNYVLKATVVNGVATYTWEVAT